MKHLNKITKSDYKKYSLLFTLLLVNFGFQLISQNNASRWNDQIGIGGSFNSAFGYKTLNSATTSGNDNSALGYYALYSVSTGINNTAFGSYALYNNTGNNNTATGYNALFSNTSGLNNTGSGLGSLYGNTTGNSNTAFGYNCLGSVSSGANNCGIGSFADVSATWGNQIAIGYNAVPSSAGNDIIALGDANTQLLECEVALTVTSDERFKENVNEEDVKGLQFISLLRPVTYKLNRRKYAEIISLRMPKDKRDAYLKRVGDHTDLKRYSGFIAQEVESAAQASGYNFDGVVKPLDENGVYHLSYATFVVPLVKAVQEQQKMILSLQQNLEKQASQSTLGSKPKTTSLRQDNSIASGFRMAANRPNPFSFETIIDYFLPSEIDEAVLEVKDLTGNVVFTKIIVGSGSSSVTLKAENFRAGVYIYCMRTKGGHILGSKKMIVE